MVKKGRDYYIVELITIVCYALGLILACITGFIPFIFITLATYPISNKVLSNINEEKLDKLRPRLNKNK